MKLDSIIYDTNTLANALTEQLVNESPTFKAMYPSETSTALVNLLAGYGSMLQYTIVSALANCYTDTVFSPTAIRQLAEMLGNRLRGNTPAKLYCDIERTSLRGQDNIVIPSHSVFDVEGLPFFNEDAIVFTLNSGNWSYGVLLTQGEYSTVEFVTTGGAGEKFYFSSDFKCDLNTVKVYVDGVRWSTTDTFLSLNSTGAINEDETQIVMLRMSSDGRAYIKIGNNSNGMVPKAGTLIRVEYVSNDGSKGNFEKTNVSADLITQIYGVENGQDVLLTVDINAPQPSYGGFDTQSLEALKETSPFIFGSGDRAIRRDDYKALLINKCGYISSNVWGEYEEAQTNGGYDKIMMNMVYYTGIKEIQKYDYRPMKTLTIADNIEKVTANNPVFFTDSVGTIQGFPGSYEIDLIYSPNNNLQIRYADKNGNGVLICDPSDNDGKVELYPYDDSVLLKEVMSPHCNQDTTSEDSNKDVIRLFTNKDKEPGPSDDPENYKDFEFVGTMDEGLMRLSFNSPLQIAIEFTGEPQAISMFAFRTPKDIMNLDYFPGLVSIYATDSMSAEERNVKNDSDWERIAEVQMINVPEKANAWSDWITTNLFRPGSTNEDIVENGGWRKYKKYMIEFYSLHDDTKNTWGAKCFIGQIKFVLDKVTSERYAWGGQEQEGGDLSAIYYTKSSDPQENDEIFDVNMEKLSNYVVSRVKDRKYLMFKVPNSDPVIEAENLCTEKTTARKMITVIDSEDPQVTKEVQETKMAVDHKTSTINYESNAIVDMCIPALLNGNSSADTMSYYKYNVEINGLTAANGYRTNDMLYYSFGNGMYANVKVTNIDDGTFEYTINRSRGALGNSEVEQTGNRKIDISDVNLKYLYEDTGSGSGAKLSVISEDAVGVFGTFTGNSFNTATAQSIDSPIIEQYNHFTTYVEFRQPRVKNVKIDVTIEYDDGNSYRDTKRKVIEAINSIFEITPYYIGKSLDVADIWAAINNVAGVKKFIVTYPIDNITCKPYEFIALPANNLTITDKFSEDFK